jgi:hypothetical protein
MKRGCSGGKEGTGPSLLEEEEKKERRRKEQ